MKLLNASEMKWLDEQTILNEPVLSIDLMERAAMALCSQILLDYPDRYNFVVFCGKGNNGGDGLALSRMLLSEGRKVKTIIPGDIASATPEFSLNLKRLRRTEGSQVLEGPTGDVLVSNSSVCIDALFGNGFKLPVAPPYLEWIQCMNENFDDVISIDINSGMPSDMEHNLEIKPSEVVHSTVTYCIGAPKMSLLFPETGRVCGRIVTIDIGHDTEAWQEIETPLNFLTDAEASRILPNRRRFAYKNSFGHVLVMAGSRGKTGAAFLCGRSAMETGAGLVSYATCSFVEDALQISFPEAMTLTIPGDDFVSGMPEDNSKFDVLAIGPGLGSEPETMEVVVNMIENFQGHMVVDADALNAISKDSHFLWPKEVIITPHPGEFDRLTKQHDSSYQRFLSQVEYSKKHQITVVLKGAYTSISLPDGTVYFNMTGSSAMAKAGSGDVLTGMIAALLAQGLTPEKAAKLGVYLHGRSGEIAAAVKGMYSVNASDLIRHISGSIQSLKT
jgi:NAD(P)H-hydrate epimerase